MEESLGEREEICGICGHLYPCLLYTSAKLTAILRVANALDRSHRQKIREIKVTLKDNHTMQILVDTTEDLTLEQALFGEKAEFF